MKHLCVARVPTDLMGTIYLDRHRQLVDDSQLHHGGVKLPVQWPLGSLSTASRPVDRAQDRQKFSILGLNLETGKVIASAWCACRNRNTLFGDSRWDLILLILLDECIYVFASIYDKYVSLYLGLRVLESKVQIVAKCEQYSWSWKAGPTRIPGGCQATAGEPGDSVLNWQHWSRETFPKRFHVPAILQAASDRASF